MLLIALTLASLATATATPARLATSTLSRRYVAQDGGCRPGDTLCSPANENGTGGWCVDLLTDPNNCGACDKGCFSGFGRCINGYCPHNDPNACEPGLTGCEGGPTAAFPFTCMDLQSNRENCGACFVRCRDDQSCKAGQCIEDPNAPPLPPQPWTTCEKDFKWCDGGCVNTDNDNMNCGGCRNMVSSAFEERR